MIDLEIPKKFVPLVKQAGSMADEVFRPVSRKYDLAEHEYPRELDLVSALIDGMSDSGAEAERRQNHAQSQRKGRKYFGKR